MVIRAWPVTFAFAVIVLRGLGQQTYMFAGHDITLSQKVSVPKVERSAQSERDFELKSIEVDVDKNVDFRSILKKNRIVPDGDSLGLIYDLNPGISDLSTVQSVGILVPAMVRVDASAANEDDLLFEIRTDQALKEEIVRSIGDIRAMTEKLEEVSDSYFGSSQTAAKIKDETRSLSESLGDIASAISEKIIPFPREVVVQLGSEVQMLKYILTSIVAGHLAVDSSTETRLFALGDDFGVKERALGEVRGDNAPARWPAVSVVVRTLKKGNVEVGDYRVHYVPVALAGVPGSEMKFERLSSPAEASLPEANYRIWASFSEDSKRVSEELDRRVRDDGTKHSYELRVSE